MWKWLTHPNVLPFLGMTTTPLQLISNWMPGGDLSEHVKKNPDVDRLELVRYSCFCLSIYSTLTPTASYPTSLRASATSTPPI